jgi:hypothetical protein
LFCIYSTVYFINHEAQSAGALPFGRIFNLTRARKELHKPLVEWLDVKDLPSPTSTQPPPDSEREPLGCFSSRKVNDPRPNRVSSVTNNLRLDIAYSRAPTPARLDPSNKEDDFLVFAKLAPYIFPRRPRPPPNGHFEFMEASPLGQKLPPDEQMTCFDYLYYISSDSEAIFEWQYSWSPPWVQVAKYLHFTDDLVEIVKGYLRRVFESDDVLPVRFYPTYPLFLVCLIISSLCQFIAVHARRGDFAHQCWDTPGNCLIPLAAFKKKVDGMIKEIRETKEVDIKKVIFMSGMLVFSQITQFLFLPNEQKTKRTQNSGKK